MVTLPRIFLYISDITGVHNLLFRLKIYCNLIKYKKVYCAEINSDEISAIYYGEIDSNIDAFIDTRNKMVKIVII